jgi:hypothetical protein
MMIEGSGSRAGSGSIPLISGSGSGSRRPKTRGFGSGFGILLVRYRKIFLIFEKLKGFTADVRHANKPTFTIF